MLDTISRRKPMATYGKSQRKRKSAELFAEALDEMSPHQLGKVHSSSPEVEHLESSSSLEGASKARRIDTTKTNPQAISTNSRTRASATGSKSITKSIQTNTTIDGSYAASLEETTINKTNLPVRSRFHDRNKNTKSTDVFDLPSSDEETIPKVKRSDLSKKFTVPSRIQSGTRNVNTSSQNLKGLSRESRQYPQDHGSTARMEGSSRTIAMKGDSHNSRTKEVNVTTRNLRSRSETPSHDAGNDSRRMVAFDMSPERLAPREKPKSREFLRQSPAKLNKSILKPTQSTRVTQTTSTTTDRRTNSGTFTRQRVSATARSAMKNSKPKETDLDEPMRDANYGDYELEEAEDGFKTGILSDDLVNESMLVGEETPRANPRAVSLRPRNTSPSKRIESNLTNFLGDFVTTTEPPRKGRIKDALKAGLDYVPHDVSKECDEDIQFESQVPRLEKAIEKEPLSLSEDIEMLLNTSQDIQVESQNSGSNSQPRDHLLPTRTVRNTYLRTRSYLTEEMAGEDPFAAPLIPSPVKTQPAFDEGLEDDGPKKGGLRSMHELREAGGSKRFLDDMEGYMEDVESTELYRQRSAFMELANKMCDENSQDRAFVKKFRANNFDQRLLKDISTQNDEIIRFCIGYVLCIFLSEDTTGRTINQIRHNGTMSMLLEMLDSDRDILHVARDKSTKMSKITQSLLADVRKKVISSSSFKDDKIVVLSSRLIALKVLEQVLQSVKHAGFDDDLVSAFEVDKFAHILKPYCELRKPSSELNLSMLQLPICILEILSNGGNSNFHSQLDTTSLETIIKLLASVLQWQSSDEELSEKIKDTQCLTLRLAINLTNHHKRNSTSFATSPGLLALVVETTQRQFALLSNKEVHEDEEVHILQEVDILVLCLALVGSFAEFSIEARKMIVSEHVNKVTCIDALVTIFLDKIDEVANADSHEEAQANVAFGYLSVAIALFCEDSKIRRIVQARLPKKSLVPLCNAVEEFLAHHRSVDTQQQLQELADMHVASSDAFTARLEKVLEELKVHV